MGTCGCRYCPVVSPVKHIATMTMVSGCNGPTGENNSNYSFGDFSKKSDAIETHTRKCVVDSAKAKVLEAFDEYIKLESGWELVETLKEKILSAK